MTAPIFVGLCDVCCSAKDFDNECARDQWELFHPHQEDYSNV